MKHENEKKRAYTIEEFWKSLRRWFLDPMEQYMGKECKISQNPRYETIADKQDKLSPIQLSCPGLEPPNFLFLLLDLPFYV